ncbi:MAG TPA: ABC transporter ATP-binding protein [Candidatus Limnocylindria bacterium]|nr:ABC transporter ATP-binding protein [Candidatus Limnocylindria bacterium]
MVDAAAVELRGVTKLYGRTTALDGLDLEVRRGEVFGLLGANGAGKTTAVKILLGLTRLSSGSGSLLGAPLGDAAARAGVGYLPELFRYQGWLTGREVLQLHLGLAGLARETWREETARALATADLERRADSRVGSYSKGMQQRLGLAVALLGRPALVVLDEPSTALDPLGRHELRGTIRGLREQGTTVLLNSHQLTEIEQVCDRVAIIDRGRVLAIGALAELLRSGGVRLRVTGLSEAGREALGRHGPVEADGAWLVVRDAVEADVPELVAVAVADGARVYGVELLRPSLEDRFRQLLGEP